MDCKEFQTRLLQDPSCEQEDFTQHGESCPACAEKWQQAQAFEAVLRVAVQVQPEKVLDMVEPGSTRTRGWKKTVALGFSILMLFVVAVLGFNFTQQKLVVDDLPQLVTHHIQKEPELLETRVVLDQMTLMNVLSPMKFELLQTLDGVTAIAPCWIRQGRGIHLVVQAERGPVSVLLMPGEYLQQDQNLRLATLSGVIVPTSWGSMAVVSHAGDDVTGITDTLQHTVGWKGMLSRVEF